MNDLDTFLLPIVGEFPLEYRSLSSISKYAAYDLLVDACKKSVLAFDTFYRAVPPDVKVTQEYLVQWGEDIKTANEAAIMALHKALIAVEEAG